MDDVQKKRIAENQVFFRDVNHRMSEAARRTRTEDVFEFICECGDISCVDRVPLSLAEYTKVRINPRMFAMLPGHEVGEIERVVERYKQFQVAEKIELSGRIAEQNAPKPRSTDA